MERPPKNHVSSVELMTILLATDTSVIKRARQQIHKLTLSPIYGSNDTKITMERITHHRLITHTALFAPVDEKPHDITECIPFDLPQN